MEKDGREPFQNDLIKHGSEWYGSSTSCMNPRSSTVMCSPTVGAGGMALRGRCGGRHLRGRQPWMHGGFRDRVGRGDPGDVSHDAGCLMDRAVSVGRGAAVLWIVEVAVSGRARREDSP